MCYAAASKLSGQEIFRLQQEFGLSWEEKDRGEYFVVNGYSHPKLPVITAGRRFKNYRWGLIPAWVKDWESAKKSRAQCLNAIGEEVEGKPSFRDAVKNRQFCIIPLNGFYEWHHHANGQKYPHFIYPRNEPYFLVAGLYNQWTNKELDEVHDTFTILTTRANERMEWIHNAKKRMPVILTKDQALQWLDQEIPFELKKELLEPFDAALMADHPVSRLITSRKENPNTPAVMQPVEYPELALR